MTPETIIIRPGNPGVSIYPGGVDVGPTGHSACVFIEDADTSVAVTMPSNEAAVAFAEAMNSGDCSVRAAAPELLEALEAWDACEAAGNVFWDDKTGDDAISDQFFRCKEQALKLSRAAIAKAKGGDA